MPLQDVEAVNITILMDNCTDFLLTNSPHARRQPLIINEKYNLPAPIAEHGFSALISTFTKNRSGQGHSEDRSHRRDSHSSDTTPVLSDTNRFCSDG